MGGGRGEGGVAPAFTFNPSSERPVVGVLS